MRLFRSRYVGSWVVLSLLLDLSGASLAPFSSTPVLADSGVDLKNPRVPLVSPLAISTSCNASGKKTAIGSVSTGNAIFDGAARVADTIFAKEDAELDDILNDEDDEASGKRNSCKFKGKMDIGFDCEAAYPGGGLPSVISNDPEVACKLAETTADGKKKFRSSLREANLQAVCKGACVQRKKDVILAEKACLDQVENELRENLKKYGGVLSEYSKQVAEQLENVDGELKERESMVSEAKSLLQGDKESGKMGLLGAQQSLKKLSANLPSLAKSVKQAAEGVKKDQEGFKIYQKQLAMNRAVSCFKNEPSPTKSFTCDGTPVSAYRYIECQLNKKYSKSRGNLPILDRKKKELAALMSEIETAAVPPTPPQPGQSGPPPGSSQRFGDLSQLTNAYSGKMSALGKEVGIDLSLIFSQQVSHCYRSKYAEVQKELQTTGTELNRVSTNLSNMQSNFTLQGGGEGGAQPVSAIITQISDQYREALSAAGFDVPVPTGACLQGTPEVQANCVQALSNAVQSSLTGVLTETSREKLGDAAWQLTGNMVPRTNFDKQFGPQPGSKYGYLSSPMRCAGIDKCVTELQKMTKSLSSSYESRVQEKKSFVSRANMELKKQSENLGNGFKAASQDLKKKINELEKAMQSAGFQVKKQKRDKEKGEGLKPQTRKNHKGEEEDSLYAAEDLEEHALQTAGAPGLLADLDNVQDALGRDSKVHEDAEEMMKVAKQNLATMESLEDRCTQMAQGSANEKSETCKLELVKACASVSSDAVDQMKGYIAQIGARMNPPLPPFTGESSGSTQKGVDCSEGGIRRYCAMVSDATAKDGGKIGGRKRTAGSHAAGDLDD